LRLPAGGSDPRPSEGVLVSWSVSTGAAQWLPKLDALALECLAPGADAARRWLRQAPRYLGRLAQSTRLLDADGGFAARFMERVKQLEGAPVRVEARLSGGIEEFTSACWKSGQRAE
jgi:hypothetical protein